MIGRNFKTRIYITSFFLILLLPLFLMNLKKDQVSEIDNRMLTELTGIKARNWAEVRTTMWNVEDYLKDRVGLRSVMIDVNEIIYDKVFGISVHPLFDHGKNGHIFPKFGKEATDYDSYLPIYADFIKKMQDYCQARGASFCFALNPSKTILYRQFLPNGISYQFLGYKALLGYLSERNIRYVDLAEQLLKVKDLLQLPVCDVKFDVLHWNAHGAFYGLSAILDEMSKDYPSLSNLNRDDFNFIYNHQISLQGSRYSIDEDTPSYTPKTLHSVNISNDWGEEVRVSEVLPGFVHYKNFKNPSAPKIFIFHGSHLNVDNATTYIADQFSEAVFVCSYGVISNLPYYFNLFQPDIVLYEVADRTINRAYLNMPSLESTVLPPAITAFEDIRETDEFILDGTKEFVEAVHAEDEHRLMDAAFSVAGARVGYAYMRLDNTCLDFAVQRAEKYSILTITLDKRLLSKCHQATIVLISEELGKKKTVSIEW